MPTEETNRMNKEFNLFRVMFRNHFKHEAQIIAEHLQCKESDIIDGLLSKAYAAHLHFNEQKPKG